MRHCTGAGECHSHFVQRWDATRSGAFNAQPHDFPSHLELRLTATDANGATASTVVELHPKTVVLTFQTNPGGLKLSSVAVGTNLTDTPFSLTVIVGSQVGVVAPTSQEAKGGTYLFRSWSNGGAASHSFTAPATATTYTATYRKR
jgi:hypothetical protein